MLAGIFNAMAGSWKNLKDKLEESKGYNQFFVVFNVLELK